MTKKRKRTPKEDNKRKKSKTNSVHETPNLPNEQLIGTWKNGKKVRVRLVVDDSDSGENDSGENDSGEDIEKKWEDMCDNALQNNDGMITSPNMSTRAHTNVHT